MSENERGNIEPIDRRNDDALNAELRRKIEIGVEQAQAGQLSDGRAFFENLRRKIRRQSTR